MNLTFSSRIKKAWNAFLNRDPTNNYSGSYYGSYGRPDRVILSRGTDRTILTAIYNRMALDVASLDIKHCRLDDKNRYKQDIDSTLNECLTLSSNIDQIPQALIQDVCMSMFDEGSVAIVPVDIELNNSDDPSDTSSYSILSLRTGKIMEWRPQHVKVNLYNDRTGRREDVIVPKSRTAIIENPFYSVMNEPNSVAQRLKRKLTLLDVIDEQSGSGKLDLIIQLPYGVKSALRKQQAEERRQSIEDQLTGTKYGIAYIDSTEKITQLNRPVENNLMKQIEYLTSMLYSQLGLTQSIMDGTADDKTMTNYYSRTIEPIISAIVAEMHRKFLSKTARSQKQAIKYFRNPFKLVPVSQIAEMADKFTRNEIASSNEFRQVIGWIPSDDPKADELRNSNISHPAEEELALINKNKKSTIDNKEIAIDENDKDK